VIAELKLILNNSQAEEGLFVKDDLTFFNLLRSNDASTLPRDNLNGDLLIEPCCLIMIGCRGEALTKRCQLFTVVRACHQVLVFWAEEFHQTRRTAVSFLHAGGEGTNPFSISSSKETEARAGCRSRLWAKRSLMFSYSLSK